MAALFWSGNTIIARAVRDFVPPAALSFWRWVFAFLVLIPFAWPFLRRDLPIICANWRIMLVLGALEDRISLRQTIGVLISITGAITIVMRGNLRFLSGSQFNIGDAIVAFAVLLWAFYSVFLRKRPSVHPLSFLAATLAIGIVILAPTYAAELSSRHFIIPRWESWAAIAYVSIFPSLLAYLCFNRSIELIGSASAGQFLNVMPLIGAGLALLFLGEQIHTFHLAGLVLVIAGIFISGRGIKTHPEAGVAKLNQG